MPHYLTCRIASMLDRHLTCDLDHIRRAEGARPEHVVGDISSTKFYYRLRRAQAIGTVHYAGLVLLNHAMFVQDLSNHDHAVEAEALRVVDPLVPGISRPLMAMLMRSQRHGNAFYSTTDSENLRTLQRVLESLGFGWEPWIDALAYLDHPVDAAPAPVCKPTLVLPPPAFPYRPKTVRSY